MIRVWISLAFFLAKVSSEHHHEDEQNDAISLLQLRAISKSAFISADDSKADSCPCTDGPTLNLKKPAYSNLGGAGPDTNSPKEVLYPDAGVIDGQAVSVRVWTDDNYKGKSSKNGVVGSLGRISMKTSQTVNFKLAVVKTQSKEIVKLNSLAMTFLDLDEGKNAKGRVTVSACGAELFTPESTELTLSHDGGCSSASSSTKGTGADNPRSVEGGLADDVASKRIASYIFKASDDGIYSFTFDVSAGYGVRNFLFSLSPGAACMDDANMPDGCDAALEEEALDLTTTTESPQDEAIEYVIANAANECPGGSSDIADAAACEAAAPSLKYGNQRNGRWENRGSNFGFMPYGCVLYTGWSSGQHEAIVLWNNNKNGNNDGNRAKVCKPGAATTTAAPEEEAFEFVIANRANSCPEGSSEIADAAACQRAAPFLKYGNQRNGRWENRGSNFGFMPPGCVLYTGWSSGQHEAIVLWNDNQNGKNDGNRAKVCAPFPAEEEEAGPEPIDYVIAHGQNSCPPGSSPLANAAECEAAAPSLQYANQRNGRWQNRGSNFGFMPPGCVLYTGWPSGQHEAIVLWNNNQNGKNDGNRAVVCKPGGEAPAEEAELPEPFLGVGQNSCPAGKSPIANAVACEAIAPRLKYGNQRHGRWQNRGSNFGFMPPGCVLYTGWPSGQHEAIVLWNNNQNGRNDGNRAIVCQ